MSRQYDDAYSYDYLATQAAEAQAVVDAAVDSASFTVTGTVNGQAAIWNGTAFVAGAISGDSNGVSVGVVTSPAFGLQVTLSQNLTTAGSPTFAALTLTAALTVGNGGTGATTASAARTNLGIDAIATKKSNLAATAAPGASDDNTAGYAVGSIWCDTTADDAYICLDASTGAAVWKKITP